MAPDKRRLRLKIKVTADPTRIWEAITNPLKLAIWFCNKAELNPKLRGAVRFRGENLVAAVFPEKEIQGTITDFTPNRQLRFTWKLMGAETEVNFRIDDKGRTCDFLVTHDNLPKGALMMDAWIVYLYNLQSLLHLNRPAYRLDYSRLERGTIKREIFIEALPHTVFKALTNQEDLRVWFSSKMVSEPAVGGKYETGWKDKDGNPEGSMTIKELVDGKRLVYDWQEHSAPAGDTVTWELLRIGEKTRVNLKHSGFPADKPDRRYTQGWHAYMLVLKDYCESGGELSYKVIDGDWSM